MRVLRGIKAPVKKGAYLGKLAATVDNKIIGTVNLVAPKDIESNWLGKVLSLFERIRKLW